MQHPLFFRSHSSSRLMSNKNACTSLRSNLWLRESRQRCIEALSPSAISSSVKCMSKCDKKDERVQLQPVSVPSQSHTARLDHRCHAPAPSCTAPFQVIKFPVGHRSSEQEQFIIKRRAEKNTPRSPLYLKVPLNGFETAISFHTVMTFFFFFLPWERVLVGGKTAGEAKQSGHQCWLSLHRHVSVFVIVLWEGVRGVTARLTPAPAQGQDSCLNNCCPLHKIYFPFCLCKLSVILLWFLAWKFSSYSLSQVFRSALGSTDCDTYIILDPFSC